MSLRGWLGQPLVPISLLINLQRDQKKSYLTKNTKNSNTESEYWPFKCLKFLCDSIFLISRFLNNWNLLRITEINGSPRSSKFGKLPSNAVKTRTLFLHPIYFSARFFVDWSQKRKKNKKLNSWIFGKNFFIKFFVWFWEC